MPSALVRQPTPAEADLLFRRGDLAALRTLLSEREVEAVRLRAHLRAFESRYLSQVGVLYAELDELEALIAEREVVLYASDAARQRAAQARQRANETHNAAYGEDSRPDAVEPTAELKRLFREVARRIHPDFATSASEQIHFTRLMARANKAYARGDSDILQRILDDFHETSDATDGTDLEAELTRTLRQIEQAQRDLLALEEELRSLPQGEIAQFQNEAEAAAEQGRDLLAELAATLRGRIADAQYRSQFLDRQMYAHGR